MYTFLQHLRFEDIQKMTFEVIPTKQFLKLNTSF